MVIYKTTNLINGRYYIGKNKTNKPSYLGSGKILKNAFKKYGKENFKKEIIEYCENEYHLNERERFWIKELNCQSDPLCYNIGEGGLGGDNISFNPNKEIFIEKMRKINAAENNGMFGKRHTDDTKLKQKEKSIGRYSLQWFIERYGEASGMEQYNKRCLDLSEKRKGENNHEYRHVPEVDLLKLILETDLSIKYVGIHFNVGSTCIYGKLKKYWNCKNLNEVRLKFNSNI